MHGYPCMKTYAWNSSYTNMARYILRSFLWCWRRAFSVVLHHVKIPCHKVQTFGTYYLKKLEYNTELKKYPPLQRAGLSSGFYFCWTCAECGADSALLRKYTSTYATRFGSFDLSPKCPMVYNGNISTICFASFITVFKCQ